MARALARIDLGAVERNCARLKAEVGAGVELCAVVKADAYGHGADGCARAALAGGADRLAVATGRRGGGGRPPLPACAAADHGGPDRRGARRRPRRRLRDRRLAQGLLRPDRRPRPRPGQAGPGPRQARQRHGTARQPRPRGRAGARPRRGRGSQPGAGRGLDPFRHRRRTGARSSSPSSWAASARSPPRRGRSSPASPSMPPTAPLSSATPIPISTWSAAGSPSTASTRSRAIPPSAAWLPALSLRSYVADVKRFEAGDSAGYGRTWRASGPTVVGVIPIGYGDGVRRAPLQRL